MTKKTFNYTILIATAFALIIILGNTDRTPRGRVVVTTENCTIVYSEILQQPISCQYVIDCSIGDATRKGLDFYTCDSIITSDDADYAANDWDKGHLAPAANFVCSPRRMKLSFSYLNCALQHFQLNRGVWKELEVRERYLAKTRTVRVDIQVAFSSTSKKLTTGATVPDSFTKTITYNDTCERYTFKNAPPKYKGLTAYKIN